jgi:NAD(P)-dependent dehydrogenase (short-subunit alcohol dehydrogenase family)
MATGVDAPRAQATVEGIRHAGGQAIAKQPDVISESDWQAVIIVIMRAWGGLDVLVANAGISVAQPVTEMTRRNSDVSWPSTSLATRHSLLVCLISPFRRNGLLNTS